jgi:hypothetical protein
MNNKQHPFPSLTRVTSAFCPLNPDFARKAYQSEFVRIKIVLRAKRANGALFGKSPIRTPYFVYAYYLYSSPFTRKEKKIYGITI